MSQQTDQRSRVGHKFAEQRIWLFCRIFDAHQAGYTLSYEAAARRHGPFLSGISQLRTWLLPSADADAAMAEHLRRERIAF